MGIRVRILPDPFEEERAVVTLSPTVLIQEEGRAQPGLETLSG